MEKIGGRFILIYFVLLFAGLAFSALGYRFNVLGFIIAGVIWILVTPFAVRSTVPAPIRKWSIIFLLVGGLGGAFTAIILGENIKPIVGLMGGAMIGGVGGWLLFGIVVGPVLHLVVDAIFPKISTIVLFVVFALGVYWGATSLSSSIPKYFETTGGGMLIGGMAGTFFGILLGAQNIKREGEWQLTDRTHSV